MTFTHVRSHVRSVVRRPQRTAVLAATLAAALAATVTAPSSTVAAEAPRAAAAAPFNGASGIGDPYWPLDGNGGIDVASYKIANRYGLGSGQLSGRTRIDLTATQDLSRFSLDFLLKVSKVTVDGQPAEFVRAKRHELQITPAQPLTAGSAHRVVVRYADQPGKYAYAGERNWLADKNEVVAMNQPHMAPWWFPANDHPLDKALVDVKIRVANGREVISNGILRGRKVGKRTTQWHWSADEPMAPYLAFFAAGDFTIKRGTTTDGLPWLIAVSKHLTPSEYKGSLRFLQRTPEVVAALEKDLGDYPFSTVGGLTTSLDPGFALENQTRPTYPPVGPARVTLAVHELAHQWFGDDIAVEKWADIWVNEGFATFMEWRWTETHGGPSAAEVMSTNYDTLDATSSFWDVPIGDPGPARVFDPAVYERGAMTLQGLRARVGEENFWKILRTWIAEQRGGNGSSAEFEALAERISGQDLDAFFTAWLRTPDRPAKTADNGFS